MNGSRIFNAYNIRRFFVMLAGIVLIGISIGFIKLAGIGVDPCTSCMMGIEGVTSINYAIVLIFFNAIFLIIEFVFSRHLIGIGTIVNGLCIGSIVNITSFYIEKFSNKFNIHIEWNIFTSVLVLFLAMIVMSFAVALYQVADMGVAPYDSLSLIAAERTGIKYFIVRVTIDAISVAVPIILGVIDGVVGVGSIILVFGVGPFVQIFMDGPAKRICYKNGIKGRYL